MQQKKLSRWLEKTRELAKWGVRQIFRNRHRINQTKRSVHYKLLHGIDTLKLIPLISASILSVLFSFAIPTHTFAHSLTVVACSPSYRRSLRNILLYLPRRLLKLEAPPSQLQTSIAVVERVGKKRVGVGSIPNQAFPFHVYKWWKLVTFHICFLLYMHHLLYNTATIKTAETCVNIRSIYRSE